MLLYLVTYGLTMTSASLFQRGGGRRGSAGTLHEHFNVVVLVEKQFQQGVS
jgi:hypothetical protein